MQGEKWQMSVSRDRRSAKPAIKLLSNKTQRGEGEVIQKGMGCDDQAYWENNHESSRRDKDIADSDGSQRVGVLSTY